VRSDSLFAGQVGYSPARLVLFRVSLVYRPCIGTVSGVYRWQITPASLWNEVGYRGRRVRSLQNSKTFLVKLSVWA